MEDGGGDAVPVMSLSSLTADNLAKHTESFVSQAIMSPGLPVARSPTSLSSVSDSKIGRRRRERVHTGRSNKLTNSVTGESLSSQRSHQRVKSPSPLPSPSLPPPSPSPSPSPSQGPQDERYSPSVRSHGRRSVSPSVMQSRTSSQVSYSGSGTPNTSATGTSKGNTRKHHVTREYRRRKQEQLNLVEKEIKDKLRQRIPSGATKLQKTWKLIQPDSVDNAVTIDKFKTLCSSFGFKIKDNDLVALFAKYDQDNDGLIGFYDFVENLYPDNDEDDVANVSDFRIHEDVILEHPGYNPMQQQSDYNRRNKYEALHKVLREKLSAKVKSGVPSSDMFKYVDGNGNGKITITEFAKLFKDLGIEATKPQVERMFNQYDANRSGSLDYDQFAVRVFGDTFFSGSEAQFHHEAPAISLEDHEHALHHEEHLQAIQTQLEKYLSHRSKTTTNERLQQFKRLGERINGKITEASFVARMQEVGFDKISISECQEVFARLDTDKDGLISLNDFSRYVSQSQAHAGGGANESCMGRDTVVSFNVEGPAPSVGGTVGGTPASHPSDSSGGLMRGHPSPQEAADRLVASNAVNLSIKTIRDKLHQQGVGIGNLRKMFDGLGSGSGAGCINRMEFMRAMGKWGCELSPQELRSAFDIIDRNRDQLIDYHDFVEAIHEKDHTEESIALFPMTSKYSRDHRRSHRNSLVDGNDVASTRGNCSSPFASSPFASSPTPEDGTCMSVLDDTSRAEARDRRLHIRSVERVESSPLLRQSNILMHFGFGPGQDMSEERSRYRFHEVYSKAEFSPEKIVERQQQQQQQQQHGSEALSSVRLSATNSDRGGGGVSSRGGGSSLKPQSTEKSFPTTPSAMAKSNGTSGVGGFVSGSVSGSGSVAREGGGRRREVDGRGRIVQDDDATRFNLSPMKGLASSAVKRNQMRVGILPGGCADDVQVEWKRK